MGMHRISSSKTPWGAIFSVVVALLYGASPIDLIPDFIPLLGWLDDAFIVPAFLLLAFFQWRRVRRTRLAANVR